MNLPVGYKLVVKGNAPTVEKSTALPTVKTEVAKPIELASKDIQYIDYTVQEDETLYSLAKLFGMSQNELVTLNPSLSSGVEEGMILKAPSTISIVAKTKKRL